MACSCAPAVSAARCTSDWRSLHLWEAEATGRRSRRRTGAISAAASSSSSSREDGEDEAIALKRRLPSPRQRWQWSKGDGPGEYGGPPLDFRIRRWGLKVEDPITSSDDYIWNKNWQPHLIPNSSSTSSSTPSSESQEEVGFLSLNRAIALDSMDIDLSVELARPVKSVLELQVEAARDGLPTDEAIKQDRTRWRMAPTRREQKQWARARKTAGMAVLVTEAGDEEIPVSGFPMEAKKNYNQLKGNLQLLTVLFGAAGAVVATSLYSTEAAISYGVGLIGSLVYIRMLGNSVDSLGKSDSTGTVRGILGQPRLLVPVVLVMFFNRWNEVFAPEYGLVHLQLIPILVGFFTYKAAALVEAFKDIMQLPNDGNPT